MKLSALITVAALLLVNEAFAQRRPPPPRRPVPVPPPRRPVPPRLPRPVPVPPPQVTYYCAGADLYQNSWPIHRFYMVNDCHVAVRDLRYRGRFCDNGIQYDRYGNFIRQYSNQYECRNWLKRNGSVEETLD